MSKYVYYKIDDEVYRAKKGELGYAQITTGFNYSRLAVYDTLDVLDDDVKPCPKDDWDKAVKKLVRYVNKL